jgi:hypothetical protein
VRSCLFFVDILSCPVASFVHRKVYGINSRLLFAVEVFLGIDVFTRFSLRHGRIARDGHGLPKVSLGPPCATLLHPYGHFRGGSSLTHLDTPRRTPMVCDLCTIVE